MMGVAKVDNKGFNHEKLRIAMLGHKRVPSREGGVEIVVEKLSVRMVEAGHEVTLYNRKGHHVSGKEYDTESSKSKQTFFHGVKIVTVPTIEVKGLAALTSSFCATMKAIFKHYDCIHYHAEGPSVMLIIPHILGIRTVATIHGLDWARSKWGGFAAQYLKFGEKIAAKFADEVIVLSTNNQKYFKETYNRNTVFIPNGISRPIKREAQLIKKNWKLEPDNYILYLGRITSEKGLEYLVNAYRNVDTNKKLVIAGGASDTDTFMNKLKALSSNDERIIFTGFVQDELLEELYSNAYLYTLPSDLEGMPLSLLEAMSYGNCCLTSDIEECAEVVENKAVLFKQGDVDDLENKLQMLCDDEVLVKTFKENAVDFICDKYCWEDVVEMTIELYRGQP